MIPHHDPTVARAAAIISKAVQVARRRGGRIVCDSYGGDFWDGTHCRCPGTAALGLGPLPRGVETYDARIADRLGVSERWVRSFISGVDGAVNGSDKDAHALGAAWRERIRGWEAGR